MRVADMHCDTISEILNHRRRGENCDLRDNGLHVDLNRLRESRYLLQNFALYVDMGKVSSPWEELCALYETYRGELAANEDILAPAYRYEDLEQNSAQGKISAVLTVEEGAVCQGEIGKLEQLYEMGVRMLTLTWNYPNELGYPNLDSRTGRKVWEDCRRLRAGNCSEQERVEIEAALNRYLCTPDTVNGLTERGREFVYCMERLGMIVDVSHLSDAGFYDVLQCSTKPFVASHSNAGAVCGCARNLTDDMIRGLAERGGCMGLNFCADFLESVPAGRENPGTIEAVVRHALHIVQVGGVEVLGLGSDFDGIDTNRELPGAQSMEKLWHALHLAGFTEGQLDRIFAENVLRVYRETWR
ncbi:MAG: dipeptidase [Clostridium sp.]|nr:dipeptidase [Acetatifactor muris]MCM1527550.1 dipeptidase [Bacteroides sp.]MCM1563792.1 dipeptidase [Clostridium sp.]